MIDFIDYDRLFNYMLKCFFSFQGQCNSCCKDGRDGRDGRNGIDGKDGKPGSVGKPGKNGVDGKDGINGVDGKDGIDGKDGKDGKQGPVGRPGKNGLDGADGKDGVAPKKNWIECAENNLNDDKDHGVVLVHSFYIRANRAEVHYALANFDFHPQFMLPLS